MSEREIIIMTRMYLISLFDNARLKAKDKDRIVEILKIMTDNLEAVK